MHYDELKEKYNVSVYDGRTKSWRSVRLCMRDSGPSACFRRWRSMQMYGAALLKMFVNDTGTSSCVRSWHKPAKRGLRSQSRD